MKTVYKALPSVVFVLFLAGMSLGLLFLPTRSYSENEKRFLAELPEVTVQGILDGTVQKKLEDYTADQLPGRNFFVGINAYWALITGRNAAQDILLCADDYLINAPENVGDETFVNNLTCFDHFAREAGVPANMMIVPSTGYLMEEVLPAFHKAYRDDEYFTQAQGILTYTKLLDLRQVLKEGVQQGQVCYKTDHHLTSFGNYLIYRSYQEALGQPFRAQSDYLVERWGGFYGTTWSGSGFWQIPPDAVELWKQEGLNVRVTFADGENGPETKYDLFYPEHLQNLDKYPVFLDGNHSLVTIQNPDAQGGSLLLIRDSYAHCLATFLAGDYKTIYLVDLRYYREDLSAFLEQHPVDQLLYLYGIDNLLTDTNAVWLK